MKKLKKQLKSEMNLEENITMVKIVDPEIVPRIRKALRDNQDLTEFIESGQVKEVFSKKNMIVDAGLGVLARILSGNTAFTGKINFGALGDGVASVVASDTVMENEIYRKVNSDSSFEDKTAYVDFFYDKADIAGTFTRFGNFIDGTATKDSGVMWTHLPVAWTKTANDGLFVSCRYRLFYKA